MLCRVARYADGWMTNKVSPEQFKQQWARIQEMAREEGRDPAKLPRIFFVNWFRKDEEGRFVWPGFGDNSRVLEWMFRRCDDRAIAEETPIGWLPALHDLDLTGLDMATDDLAELLRVEASAWSGELPQLADHYARFGDRLPAELAEHLETLRKSLAVWAERSASTSVKRRGPSGGASSVGASI